MFSGSKSAKDITSYKLFRGATDFARGEMFNMLDTGRSFFKIISGPNFVEKWKDASVPGGADRYKIYEAFKHLCEFEFKGLDGIEDLSSETMEVNDGVNTVNFINKVKEQSASTFSIKLVERSGSPITKFTKLYLTGIYDTKTAVKHYHGSLGPNRPIKQYGVEHEIFTLLYFVVDQSALEIEAAYLIVAAQLSKSNESIYNSEKGAHDNKELSIEWTGYPITGDAIYALAKSQLDSMYIIRNSDTDFSKAFASITGVAAVKDAETYL